MVGEPVSRGTPPLCPMPMTVLMESGCGRSAGDISQHVRAPMAGAWRTDWEYTMPPPGGGRRGTAHDTPYRADSGAQRGARAGTVRSDVEFILKRPEELGWCAQGLRSLPTSDLQTTRTRPQVVLLPVGAAILYRRYDGWTGRVRPCRRRSLRVITAPSRSAPGSHSTHGEAHCWRGRIGRIGRHGRVRWDARWRSGVTGSTTQVTMLSGGDATVVSHAFPSVRARMYGLRARPFHVKPDDWAWWWYVACLSVTERS